MPPLGISKSSMGLLEAEGFAAGPKEMSPVWIMKPGMIRWKGISLYAPHAHSAMKFSVV